VDFRELDDSQRQPLNVYVVKTMPYVYDDDPTPEIGPDVPPRTGGSYLYPRDHDGEVLVCTDKELQSFLRRIHTRHQLAELADAWGHDLDYLLYHAGWD
jgi:hypothetical protein